MSTLGYGGVGDPVTAWTTVEGVMDDARRDLAVEETSGVPPLARPAADAFLRAWSAYAGESARLAAGFVAALHTSNTYYRGSDRLSAEQLAHLDGRLGAAR